MCKINREKIEKGKVGNCLKVFSVSRTHWELNWAWHFSTNSLSIFVLNKSSDFQTLFHFTSLGHALKSSTSCAQ